MSPAGSPLRSGLAALAVLLAGWLRAPDAEALVVGRNAESTAAKLGGGKFKEAACWFVAAQANEDSGARGWLIAGP